MKTLENWFSESIEQYSIFTSKTVELKENMESLPLDEIEQRCSTIKRIQEEISGRDRKLHDIMAFIGPEALQNSLTGEYQRALDLAISETDLVGERAQRRKLLLLQGINSEKEIAEYSTVGKEAESLLRVKI